MQKAFLKDTLGKGSEADTLKFSTMSAEDYGTIEVSIEKKLLKDHAILLLYKDGEEIKRSSETDKPIRFELLKPESYRLRLLYDKNSNGKWDSGNLKERTQPEITIELPKSLRLKPNWENKVEWEEGSKNKKRMGKK